VWEAIQRAIYSLAEQGKVPLESGFLRDLGIEGERGHVAMGYLERRDERLRELEEEGFVEPGGRLGCRSRRWHKKRLRSVKRLTLLGVKVHLELKPDESTTHLTFVGRPFYT
jgi:hypothetical protein